MKFRLDSCLTDGCPKLKNVKKSVIKQLTKLGGYVKVNEVVRTTSTGKQVIRLTSARVSDPGS